MHLVDVDPKLLPLVDGVTDGVRKKGGMRRAKRQLDMQKIKASTEGRDLVNRRDQEAADEEQSAVGSGYNPENPYHVSNNFINNTS